MKKILALAAIILLAIGVAAAQAPTTHIVDKGETLSSIAQKYGVSESEIIKLNPEAGQFIYVGQELALPAGSKASSMSAQSHSGNPSGKTEDSVGSQEYNYEEEDKPGFQPNFSFEYGFLSKEKGVKGHNFTYGITLGASYYFMHRDKGVFAGVNIGYNSANYYGYVKGGIGNYYTEKTESHFITLPIFVGYSAVTSNGNFGVTPYAGIDVNFCVAGKTKSNGRADGSSLKGEKKLDKKTGLDARFGLKFRIHGFNVGAAYVIPLEKNDKYYFGKDGYFAVSLSFGF